MQHTHAYKQKPVKDNNSLQLCRMGSVGVSIFNIVSTFMYFDDMQNYYFEFCFIFFV